MVFRLLRNHRASVRPRPALNCVALEAREVPAVLFVDDDGVQKPGAFTTIVAALNAANPNDTIEVYKGTYAEQLTIATNGLKLLAKPSSGMDVVISAPADVVPTSPTIGGALVDVTATNVKVSGFQIDGSTSDGDLFATVRVRNGGSATISNNSVVGPTNSSDPAAGIGVQIGTNRLAGSAGAGTAKVTGNLVSGYYGAGILVDGVGGSATVTGNTITGRGAANGGVAQYGVQVSRGATARVEKNAISNNSVGGNPLLANSAGIYFFQDGSRDSVAAKNTVSGNDVGILVESSNASGAGTIKVVNNDVTGNTGPAGIAITESDRVKVKNNDVFNNTALNGIFLLTSNTVEVENNDVFGNPNADGIYVFQGANNQVRCNDSHDNGFNGIFLEQSTNDQVWNNTTQGNAANGIKVLGGTSNDIWLGSSGSNLADGILFQDTTNNTVVGNALLANTGFGLRLLNADNTLVAFNLITGNAAGSVFISADSTGTVQIGNRTDTPPVMEGTTGAAGTSLAYTSAVAAADAATAGLAD
ncbi:MAG TPA: right-handed parallel beta-helix repeat-containing protein [Gemmataceae bacterium]|nr:right-handed parallel beta-helix repeat-containing protein [Gemmataceae bacterium]